MGAEAVDLPRKGAGVSDRAFLRSTRRRDFAGPANVPKAADTNSLFPRIKQKTTFEERLAEEAKRFKEAGRKATAGQYRPRAAFASGTASRDLRAFAC
jgi:hypothetical protein